MSPTLAGGFFTTSATWEALPYSNGHRAVISSVQFSSVAQSCLTLCDPMNCSIPGLLVHHQLPEFIQTHAHRVGDAIQPSHPLLFPSPPAPNPSQHQGIFQSVNSSHEVAKFWSFSFNISPYQVPYDYTVEVRNRFKGLDLRNRVPEDQWIEVHDIV